jgi:hypothetical protein
MRIHLTGRDGYPITAIQMAINGASGITYETAMPGGMTMASCRIPWHYGAVPPRLLGAKFEVRDGIDCVWAGRVHDQTDSSHGQAQYLDLLAAGPWADAALARVTNSYVSNGVWTGTDMLKAALWGNVEDVAMVLNGDTGPAYDVGALAWSDSTVQDVIAECLRIGDDTTSSWNFVIWPPVFAPSTVGAATFSSDCDDTADFSASSGATAVRDIYHRGGSCLKFSAGAGAAAYAYQTVGAAATYAASGWFYLPKTAPAENHQLLTFYQTTSSANILVVRVNPSYIIEAYNLPATATYTATGNQTWGLGSWHHLAALCTANNGAGVAQVWYDGQLVINQATLNTGANNIVRVYVGPLSNGTAARTVYADDVIINTTAPTMADRVTAETLPEPRIIEMNRTTHDFMLSLASVQQSAFTRSLGSTVNQVRTTYGSSSYTDLSLDEDSVRAYGQRLGVPSLTRTSSATVAGYLAARYLARWKTPAAMLQPLTLTTAPTSYGGGIMPLSRIKAGMTFAIRERPDLGVFYVGGTRYQAAQPGQPESCAITPIEPAYDLATAVALREMRSRT